MMKKRLTRRLFAVCLGLIIVLSACASVDAPSGESTTTEESKATSALELSEVNAEGTSSEAEPSDEESSESEPSTPDEHLSADAEASLSGGITITPIEPTYPEERETTLELVKEYPLGEGGIPFELFAGENPAYVMPHVSDWFLADEKGNLYAYNGQRFYNFQTGWAFRPSDENQLIVAEVILDGKWYCMTLDGILNIYTEQGEKVGSVKYPKISGDGIYTLLVSPDGKLHVEADGVFYDETGKKTEEKYVLDTVKNGEDTFKLFGRMYSYDKDLYVQGYADGILTACESQDYRITQCPDGIDHSHIEDYNEVIFYQYDQNGDPLSEFLICFYYNSHKIPCNLVYKGVECKEYSPKAVIVGKQRFDNLIDANWFVGADGTIYLMLIDPNGGKLYKINPGYSDVEFTDYTAETEIQQTAATASTARIHANVSARGRAL